MSIPDILTIGEMQKLISAVRLRERVLIFLDMVTGLRRGELAGLKWQSTFEPANQCEPISRRAARGKVQDGGLPEAGPDR